MSKIMAAVLVVLVIAAALIAAYFLDLLPSLQEPPGSGGPVIPSPDITPPDTTPSPTPPAGGSVGFDFTITDIQGSGLSRDITALITNNGDSDAHNVWAKVEIFSQGSRIKVNGKDYLREDIGTIKTGETVTRNVTLSFSAFDGLKMSRSGATFKLTIYSDEHTETFSYDYSP